MLQEGEVRSIRKVSFIGVGKVVGIPLDFGVPHLASGVRLLGVAYNIEFFGDDQELARGVFCLSENPKHEVTPPVNTRAFLEDPACYGIAIWMSDIKNAGSSWGAARTFQTLTLPLYGILRGFRQILCIFNDVGYQVNFQAEIFYQPVFLGLNEGGAIARQKGTYRRT